MTLFFELFGIKHLEGELSERVLAIRIREQIPFGIQSLYFVSERAIVIWPWGHVYWFDAYSRIKRTFTFRHSKFLTLFFEMFGTGFKHFEGELSERVLAIGIREQIPFGIQSLYFVF